MSEPTTTATTTGARIRVTLVKSSIGTMKRQKQTLLSMGLRKINSFVDLPDNPSMRGMVQKVHHLVRVDETPAVTE